jgi:ribosome-associated protein
MDSHPEISKTQRKREMHALQDLGEVLVGLPEHQLQQVELPESLRAAVMEARRINKWGARRRQLQYIGRLMREADAASIRAQLESWNKAAARDSARLHRIEQWRDRLLSEEHAITELLELFPNADAQYLRTLTRNARLEAAGGKPPRSTRSLFRAIRELLEAQPSAKNEGRAQQGPDSGEAPER